MKVISLENKSVIYIDYLDSCEKILSNKFPRWIKVIVYKFLNYFGCVKSNENKIELYCLSEDKINQKMINNLKKELLLINSRSIVLSNLLLQNTIIVTILRNLGYNILSGKWLYKFLCYDIVQKIAYIRNKKISDLEITILSNENSDINIENIKLLAQECKILNVITKNLDNFKHVENLLFEQYGNIINVSTNTLKACKYSDIILNFDFSIDEIKKCNFKKGNILVQFNKEKFENRYGTTIVFYKLNLPVKYSKLFKENKNYNQEIFYESLLYYKTSFKNLRKILKKDGISIKYFEGCNGKLPFNQIKNNLL